MTTAAEMAASLEYVESDLSRVATIRPYQLPGLHESGLFRRPGEDDPHWCGGTFAEATELLRSGDHDALAKATAVSEAVKRISQDTLGVPAPYPAVCGGAVCVPAYLSGSHTPFMRLAPSPTPAGVRVFICIGGHYDVTARQLRGRGLALLGFVRALARVRPVELYGYLTAEYLDYEIARDKGGRKHVALKIPLGVHPVDWTAASAIIGHPAPLRWTLIWLMSEIGARRCVTSGGSPKPPPEDTRKLLGVRPGDIVFDSAHSAVADKQCSDPERWIREELQAYNARKGKYCEVKA